MRSRLTAWLLRLLQAQGIARQDGPPHQPQAIESVCWLQPQPEKRGLWHCQGAGTAHSGGATDASAGGGGGAGPGQAAQKAA